MSIEEISRLFTVAPTHYRLLFQWCVTTGSRRFEACSLRIKDLPTSNQIAMQGGGLVPIELLRKGSRLLTIQAPAKLVEATQWYILTERPQPADEHARDVVFLTRRGNPVSRNALTRAFRRCADEIESEATLHHLRHTFTVQIHNALENYQGKGGPMNSIKTLQVLLGHANIATTEIYRRAVERRSDAGVGVRCVLTDAGANVHKEGRPDRIPLGRERVNRWLAEDVPDLGGRPIRAEDVDRYYRSDAKTLELYLRARRFDRFVRTRLLRQRYDFILPGAIRR